MIAGTARKATGSVALTPYSNPLIRRPPTMDRARPTANPVPTSFMPPAMSNRTTPPGSAPSDMRMPTSRLRDATP